MGQSKWNRILRSLRENREKRNTTEGPEKVSVEKSVPFDLPPDQSDFPYKRKAPQVSGYKWRTNKIN